MSLKFMKMISEAIFSFSRIEQIKGDPFFFIIVQEVFCLFPSVPRMAHLHKVTREIRVVLHVALNCQPTSENQGDKACTGNDIINSQYHHKHNKHRN